MTAPAPRAGKLPGWLRHALPDAFADDPPTAAEYAVELLLEEAMSRLSDAIAAETPGISPGEARRRAADAMMAAMLGLQRQHAPDGQLGMVTALVGHDPALAPFREDMARGMAEIAARMAAERGVWRDVLLSGVGAAAGVLLAAAFLL